MLECIDHGGHAVVVNAPPRSLKTTSLAIALPIWLLGREPDQRIIIYCSQDAVAATLRQRLQRLAATAWMWEVFPAACPLQETHRGALNTRSGGGITIASVQGAPVDGVADLIIIDDPVKHTEISLEAALHRVNNWYEAAVPHRLAGGGTVLLAMPRLADRDLTATILKAGAAAQIRVTAIAGRPERWKLFNGRYHRRQANSPLPIFTRDHLDFLRRNISSIIFSLRYQQEVPMLNVDLRALG